MNTIQEEFDIVVRHLYTQGRPAREGVGCWLRLGDLTCAVGCRIPTDMYVADMDATGGLQGLIKAYGSVLPPEIIRYEKMFSLLQEAHDGCERKEDGSFDVKDLKTRLFEVASICELNTKVLESLYEC